MVPSLIGAYHHGMSRLRALRAGLGHGVTIGPGVRLGRGVRISASDTGRVSVGSGCEIGAWTSIHALDGAEVTIAADVFIAGLCTIAAAEAISVGPQSMVAEMVAIRDHDHHPDHPPRSGRLLISPVTIGARCWLAAKASVVRGGSLGDDVIVGAHALVNRPLPSAVVAVGVPAVPVRRRPGTQSSPPGVD